MEATPLSPIELSLRGAAAALLLFHVVQLLRPAPHRLARLTLAAFSVSMIAYMWCSLPPAWTEGPARLPMLALCGLGAPLLWLAVRALFEDNFRPGWGSAVVLGAALLLGVVSHADDVRAALGPVHADVLQLVHRGLMLAFGIAALWVVVRQWRADLVEARRVARRWVALVLSVYAVVTLIVELALHGQPIGRLLPTLHVAGITTVALLLALLLTKAPLESLLEPSRRGPEATALEVSPRGVDAKLQQRLVHAMTVERAYRGEDFSLPKLAAMLDVGEAALRRLINEGLGHRNFNDFVHRYRIDEASARLAAEDLPILTIALEAGYGSIGPFNRAFKQRIGMTPTEYRAAARMQRAHARAGKTN